MLNKNLGTQFITGYIFVMVERFLKLKKYVSVDGFKDVRQME